MNSFSVSSIVLTVSLTRSE